MKESEEYGGISKSNHPCLKAILVAQTFFFFFENPALEDLAFYIPIRHFLFTLIIPGLNNS